MEVNIVKNFDYSMYKGDKNILTFEFKDKNLQEVDITSYDIRFTIKDKFEEIPSLISKTRISGVATGLYNVNDAKGIEYGLTKTNQIAIELLNADTKTLRSDIYPFDIEFNDTLTGFVFTAIVGNIILQEEVTKT